jgi:hypothetical protein
MPLNQGQQKVAILAARAKAFDDAARETRAAARTGYDLADAERLATTFESFARGCRDEAAAGGYRSETVADVVERYCKTP